jgi:ribosome assembly protein YihI (activator of Der GTPase)
VSSKVNKITRWERNMEARVEKEKDKKKKRKKGQRSAAKKG